MPTRDALFAAALRLHRHLEQAHLAGGLLHGPDPGVRFNRRAWRFVRSTFPAFPWRDDYIFMQTQGYWILANWMLFDQTREPRCRKLALDAAQGVLALETPSGYWTYPLPERRHLVATVEGNWGAIGLLAVYSREADGRYLAAAERWYNYLTGVIGFQEHSAGKAINYFDRPRGKIPNNSVEAAWLFLRLWKAAGDRRFREHVPALLKFVVAVQRLNGELPYIVAGPYERARDHYLCFQYNAFQFLKLSWSRTLDPEVLPQSALDRLAEFLERGVRPDGSSASDCDTARGGGPQVDYYTAVLAAALWEAARGGSPEAAKLAEACYRRLLARQMPGGNFRFSTGDYGLLRDTRSYPRQQAMTLFHLLYGCGVGDGFPQGT